MSHVRSLRFEPLEARMLLACAHAAAPQPRPAAVAISLVLNGTLAVDDSASAGSVTENDDGGATTSTPVAGKLGTLGEVHGVWNETDDADGDLEGPDTLRLHTSKGAVVIVLNDLASGQPHPVAHGAVYYQYAQQIAAGTGPYAKASEIGTIQYTTNSPRSEIVSLTLHTRGT